MQYHYDYEIAALLFMTIILLHFMFIHQFPSDKMKVFRLLLFVCCMESAANILSCIGLANPRIVPQLVNELFAFAFFVLEGLSSYLILRYFIAASELSGKAKKGTLLFGAVPFFFFEVLVILTPVTGFFYYFKDNSYYQGFGSAFGYLYIAYFFAFNIVIVFWKRKVIGPRIMMIVFSYSVAAVFIVWLQYQSNGVILTGTGNAIIILMMYLAMLNPSEMLDPVTGIGNESAFLLQLKHILSHTADVTILTIDIRQFHHINKMLGYENSNRILQEVGNCLLQLADRFHVFRNLGDTFTVLVDSPEKSKVLEEKISERLKEEWVVQQNHVVLNTVMIIQHYPKDFDSIPDFKGMREYLLEIAKTMENSGIIETNELLIKNYYRRTKVEMAIERAVLEQSFEVYYQPIYSLKKKHIISLEALVRLKDKELGFIPPDEFIPIAEKNGKIVRIGAMVLEESCRFLSRHVLSNPSLGIKTIHVNLSAVQCLRQNLAETIVPVLEKYHIPPSMITLEVTERTAISAPDLMRKHMEEMGKLGILFSMDDYGSGHANCSYLIQFPFQEVKIDKEIVWACFEKESARVLLENEISTIQKLGLPLVIEGIEKKEQSELMERFGVECIQGYYYGKPLPEKECLRYIRRFHTDIEEYGR